MSTLTRRGFLGSLVAVAAGAFAAATAKPRTINWHPERVSSSAKYVQHFDVSQMPQRIDILYGWARINPNAACRVWSA